MLIRQRNVQRRGQLALIETDQDGAVDFKGGRSARAVRPALHLVGGTGDRVNIHLGVLQVVRLKPQARPPASRAPTRAIHDDTAMWQGWRHQWLAGQRVACRGLGVDTAQHIQHHIVVGLVVNIVDIDIADGAALVDDEDGPLGMPVRFAEHAVQLAG